MPILEVEIAGRATEGLAQKVADAVGEVLRAEKGTVWVKVREVSQYAENGGGAPAPVFVRLLRAEWPSPVVMATEAERLSLAVGKACGVDASLVNIVYEPPGVGRVAFGGRVLE